jgi:ABC-type sugar transport system permease subunit
MPVYGGLHRAINVKGPLRVASGRCKTGGLYQASPIVTALAIYFAAGRAPTSSFGAMECLGKRRRLYASYLHSQLPSPRVRPWSSYSASTSTTFVIAACACLMRYFRALGWCTYFALSDLFGTTLRCCALLLAGPMHCATMRGTIVRPASFLPWALPSLTGWNSITRSVSKNTQLRRLVRDRHGVILPQFTIDSQTCRPIYFAPAGL